MTTARRDTLRLIMRTAWSFVRAEPARGFADCLRGAWKLVRSMADFAKRARWGRRICFNSPIASPIEKALRARPYTRTEARDLSRLTARLGI